VRNTLFYEHAPAHAACGLPGLAIQLVIRHNVEEGSNRALSVARLRLPVEPYVQPQ
jgi:hypothetical protein